MKMLWTRIWIALATVFIAVVTATLIAALHLAKAVRRVVVFFSRRRT